MKHFFYKILQKCKFPIEKCVTKVFCCVIHYSANLQSNELLSKSPWRKSLKMCLLYKISYEGFFLSNALLRKVCWVMLYSAKIICHTFLEIFDKDFCWVMHYSAKILCNTFFYRKWTFLEILSKMFHYSAKMLNDCQIAQNVYSVFILLTKNLRRTFLTKGP